ncbi:hypothetical protein HS088_TW06G01144 [Tripterygium wilfordii]|uniref:Rubredoxin-like domain-containing protein n=1 Tax=Tripterygium wilfordii TaxID=458696 RepID=A0A7J7DKW5_TRIWF|nr:rubredoxin [Tripterygium wilfordii]KAF5746967.1 hypothetical protein HS088_TW06G01144 [Tripterygium wilfordii]
MAGCATTGPTFSFSITQPSPPHKQFKTHLAQSPLLPKFPSIYLHKRPLKSHFTLLSIDVSKEDKPTSDQSNPAQEVSDQNQADKFDKRRLEEKFAVLNTGIYECRSCGYKYDEAVGDPSYPIPPGFQFDKLPEDWRCPTCGAAKNFFQSKSVEIAGFAQNQQFGFGTNAMTSGQKAVLIYGSLLLFFGLFLSGYFLQ